MRRSFGVFVSLAVAPLVVYVAWRSKRAPALLVAAFAAMIAGFGAGYLGITAAFAILELIPDRHRLDFLFLTAMLLPFLMALAEGYIAAQIMRSRANRGVLFGFMGASLAYSWWGALFLFFEPVLVFSDDLFYLVMTMIIAQGCGAAVGAGLRRRA